MNDTRLIQSERPLSTGPMWQYGFPRSYRRCGPVSDFSETYQQMFKAMTKLMHSLWCQDRIRIAPGEGRLLRLSPPCILMIGSETVQALSRRVVDRGRLLLVQYECEADFGAGTLTVQLHGTRQGAILWTRPGSREVIAEDDVVVFG